VLSNSPFELDDRQARAAGVNTPVRNSPAGSKQAILPQTAVCWRWATSRANRAILRAAWVVEGPGRQDGYQRLPLPDLIAIRLAIIVAFLCVAKRGTEAGTSDSQWEPSQRTHRGRFPRGGPAFENRSASGTRMSVRSTGRMQSLRPIGATCLSKRRKRDRPGSHPNLAPREPGSHHRFRQSFSRYDGPHSSCA